MKPTNSVSKVLSIMALVLFATPALAQLRSPASPQEIESARQSGKAVLIGFHSPSCGTCRKQKPALNALLTRDQFKGIEAYTVDYDTGSALRKSFGVTQSSTLIVLKDGKEVARSIGESKPEQLEALLKSAI